MLSVTLCQTNPIINPWYLVDGKLNKFTCGGDVCIHNYLFTFPKDVSHDPFLVLLNEENQIHLESSGKETRVYSQLLIYVTLWICFSSVVKITSVPQC